VVTPSHHVSLTIRSVYIIDPLSNAIKTDDEADKKRQGAEKKRELDEKLIAVELAPVIISELEAEESRIAAERDEVKKLEDAKKREAETKRFADEREEKTRKADDELISKGKCIPKKKLMNSLKETAPTSKKVGSKPTDGKITKAKKKTAPATPNRPSMSADGSPSVYTMSNTTRKISEVVHKIHQKPVITNGYTSASNIKGSSKSNMPDDDSPSVYTMANTARKTSEVVNEINQVYSQRLWHQDEVTSTRAS